MPVDRSVCIDHVPTVRSSRQWRHLRTQDCRGAARAAYTGNSPSSRYPRSQFRSPPTKGQGIFHSAKNVAISGGHFTATAGHRTTLNININGESDHHQHVSGLRVEQYAPGNGHSGVNRSSPNCRPGRTTNLDAFDLPSRRDSDVYTHHLLKKKRGFPLYIPEPNSSLPVQYQRQGVSIGDVGIITPSGAFSFLFNFCRPASDPINPRRLPEGFQPLNLDPLHIQKFFELKPRSYLTSGSVDRCRSESSSGMSFRSSAPEGAILAIPEGAESRDLQNMAHFSAYVEANIDNWYRFVNGVLGCEARNGDLRVVVGHDKATSWGMATFSNNDNASGPTHCELLFQPRQQSSESTMGTYTWDYSGEVEARAGPEPEEVAAMRADDTTPLPGGKYLNQSLFIRTLNATLGSESWQKLCEELNTPHLDDSMPSLGHRNDSRLPHSNASAGSNPEGGCHTPSSSRFHTTDRSCQKADSEKSTLDEFCGDTLLISGPRVAIDIHPADRLNRILMRKVPNARLVISDDAAWSSFVDPAHEGTLDDNSLLKQVLSENNIVFENGVLRLTMRKDPHSHIPSQYSSGSESSTSRPECLRLESQEHDSYPLAPSDTQLVVTGPMGSGKSTFINKAVSTRETPVGHTLGSCTQVVKFPGDNSHSDCTGLVQDMERVTRVPSGLESRSRHQRRGCLGIGHLSESNRPRFQRNRSLSRPMGPRLENSYHPSIEPPSDPILDPKT